jgi:hypothetical protein
LFSFLAQASEKQGEQILEVIDKALASADINYAEILEKLESDAEIYIKYRVEYCSGEYKIYDLKDIEKKYPKKVRLTAQEKQSCLKSLTEFRKQYITKIFDLRERYLIHIQNNHIKDLRAQKQKALDHLETLKTVK